MTPSPPHEHEGEPNDSGNDRGSSTTTQEEKEEEEEEEEEEEQTEGELTLRSMKGPFHPDLRNSDEYEARIKDQNTNNPDKLAKRLLDKYVIR